VEKLALKAMVVVEEDCCCCYDPSGSQKAEEVEEDQTQKVSGNYQCSYQVAD